MGVFNDNFNRSNNGLSASADWHISLGNSNVDCQIVSNKLTAIGAASPSCRNYFSGYLPTGSQFSQATLAAVPGGNNCQMRLAVRLSSDGNTGYALLFHNIVAWIYRIDAGNDIFIVNGVVITPLVNDVFKLTATGSIVTAYQNGTPLLSINDSTYGSGFAGIGIDSFSGDTSGMWDDWTGGDSNSVRDGVFSKDRVLYVGSFDAGILPNYGLFDDDFVDQSDGTTVGATVSGMTSTCAGLFDRDANLFGLYGAS